MDEMEMNGMDENSMDDLVVFEDEDGVEYSFTVEDYFFYNGEEYALLADAEPDEEGNKGCIVCQVVPSEEDEEEEEFVPVADEDLAEKLYEIATTKLSEEEEEEE